MLLYYKWDPLPLNFVLRIASDRCENSHLIYIFSYSSCYILNLQWEVVAS